MTLCNTCFYTISKTCPCPYIRDEGTFNGKDCLDYIDTTRMTKSEIDEMIYSNEKKRLVSYIKFYENNLKHAMENYQEFLLENLK